MPRSQRTDMIGERYGSLVVSGLTDPIRDKSGRGRRKAVARCDCGNEVQVDPNSLRSGASSSCGCARVIHGHSRSGEASPTYNTWAMILSRCGNPKNDRYQRYGGRGISVCDRWHDFSSFLADMGERPAGTSIDRKDNDGNYEPGNCRWATDIEQTRNRSVSILVQLDGEIVTLKERCRATGENYQAARRKHKRSAEAAATATVNA